mmetsp:Transcript_26305/g.43908  ORF Transcript_26305/g.43908 Transcript_26305/m.43908 type:complete len:263 (-) Transcript_26305:992-1780(-)
MNKVEEVLAYGQLVGCGVHGAEMVGSQRSQVGHTQSATLLQSQHCTVYNASALKRGGCRRINTGTSRCRCRCCCCYLYCCCEVGGVSNPIPQGPIKGEGEQALHGRGLDVGALLFREWVSRQDSLPGHGCCLVLQHHQIQQRFSLLSKQTVYYFSSRNHQLLQLLRELNAWYFINLDQLVDATKRGLTLTSHQVRANTKRVDLMSFVIQVVEHSLIDVVASNYAARAKYRRRRGGGSSFPSPCSFLHHILRIKFHEHFSRCS